MWIIAKTIKIKCTCRQCDLTEDIRFFWLSSNSWHLEAKRWLDTVSWLLLSHTFVAQTLRTSKTQQSLEAPGLTLKQDLSALLKSQELQRRLWLSVDNIVSCCTSWIFSNLQKLLPKLLFECVCEVSPNNSFVLFPIFSPVVLPLIMEVGVATWLMRTTLAFPLLKITFSAKKLYAQVHCSYF